MAGGHPKIKALHELAYQYAWSVPELAAILGCSIHHVYTCLVDINGNSIQPDVFAGPVWVDFFGARIPARKDGSGHLIFFRQEVDRAFEATTAQAPLPSSDGDTEPRAVIAGTDAETRRNSKQKTSPDAR